MSKVIPLNVVNEIIAGLLAFGDRSIISLTYENGDIIKIEPERETRIAGNNARANNVENTENILDALSVVFHSMSHNKYYGFISVEFEDAAVKAIVDKRVYKSSGLNDDKMLLGEAIQKAIRILEG